MEQMTAQMNIRMSASLKSAGDMGLSQAQISPSRAVRALWSYCEQHRDEPAAISKMVEALEAAPKESPESRKANILKEGERLIERTAQLVGAVATDSSPAQSDNDLLEAALLKRYEERGLL